MSDVTDKQQEQWDPWVDHPDPGPDDFAPYLSEMKPEDVEHFPGNPHIRTIFIGDEDANDWIRKRDAAHARGERLPEEIEADERVEAELARRARQALEQDHH
ncbi:MAG TPA: hypothetical protein VEB65_04075 [Solirubrobacterales bacterium]|nr:hypothetical protein [Solirubrobacterales bacterium]